MCSALMIKLKSFAVLTNRNHQPSATFSHHQERESQKRESEVERTSVAKPKPVVPISWEEKSNMIETLRIMVCMSTKYLDAMPCSKYLLFAMFKMSRVVIVLSFVACDHVHFQTKLSCICNIQNNLLSSFSHELLAYYLYYLHIQLCLGSAITFLPAYAKVSRRVLCARTFASGVLRYSFC